MTLFHRSASAVATLFTTHISFTLASIGRASIGSSLKSNNATSNNKHDVTEGEEECFDAKHYDLVTDFVGRMYHKRSRKVESLLNNPGVKLSPDVTFEDPAAVCITPNEVMEAFRALRALEPTSLLPSRCVNVKPDGGCIKLKYLMNQKYTLPSLPFFRINRKPVSIELKSYLIVTVQLEPIKEIPGESEFLITNMKELWNGNPFIWPYSLFYIPRRLNGIVSYNLTSWLL